MKFTQPLIPGRLIKRYKRFLADIELLSGELITAHTANPGSMLGLLDAGNPVHVSHHPHSNRKLKHSWEMVQVNGIWVGINTSLPNRLVEEALQAGSIPELCGFKTIRREVPYGEKSRIDLLLESEGDRSCYVEVKNVTMTEGQTALFPDAVTERGTRHLHELSAMVKKGDRAVQFFLIQREDCTELRPADPIDAAYGKALRMAAAVGVEIIAYRSRVTPEGIEVTRKIPVVLR